MAELFFYFGYGNKLINASYNQNNSLTNKLNSHEPKL